MMVGTTVSTDCLGLKGKDLDLRGLNLVLKFWILEDGTCAIQVPKAGIWVLVARIWTKEGKIKVLKTKI